MKMTSTFSTPEWVNAEDEPYQPRISWGSVIAGTFVAFLVYATLLSLGVGFGGASVAELIEEGDIASGIATGAALWMALSVLLSLMAGAYFASRMACQRVGRMGAAHGLVVAALFFGFMLYGAGQTISFAGKGFGNIVSSVGFNTDKLMSNSVIRNSIENSLGPLELKSSPDVVIQGLLTRLLQGNREAAKNYLSQQSSLTDFDLDTEFTRIESEFNNTMQTVGVKTSNAVASAAWTIYWTLLIGIIAAALSGAYATRVHLKREAKQQDDVDTVVRKTNIVDRPSTT